MNEPQSLRHVPIRRACAMMGIGRTRCYELIRDGLIVARKLGRRTFVDLDSVERMFAALPEIVPIHRHRLLTAAELGLEDSDNQPRPLE